MEIHAINILYDFCIISALLLVAKIIRSRVRFIQKLYIPSSLLAGILGLIGGKYFLNVLPFSTEISSYSSILIAVLFATLFLGNKKKASFKKMIRDVGDTFLVNTAAEIGQFGVFILIGIFVLPLLFHGINAGFGLMLPAGFIGGHGTAAAIGSAFADVGWDEATSIGQTFATIGLLVGIIGGIIMINVGARRKYTRIITEAKELPEEMRTGLVPEDKRVSMGDNTVNSMSIDPLTWHLLLVLVAVGAAYLVNMGLKKILPELSFPIYGLALLTSLLLQWLLKGLKMDAYVDKKVVTRIGSTATDYLIAFGIASININIVLKYWVPILLLSVLGTIFVIVWQFTISKRFYHNYWFERGMYVYGMSTGVMATGVILLRVTDPEFESGVLEDFGFAWIFLSVIDMLVVSLSPLFISNGLGWAIGAALVVLAALCLVVSGKLFGVYKDDGTKLREGEKARK